MFEIGSEYLVKPISNPRG